MKDGRRVQPTPSVASQTNPSLYDEVEKSKSERERERERERRKKRMKGRLPNRSVRRPTITTSIIDNPATLLDDDDARNPEKEECFPIH